MENFKDNQFDVWEVFIQSKPGLPHIHAGNVHATDKSMAVQNARDTYTRRGEGTSIWVVPAVYVTATEPDDSEMLFDPSNDKLYRHPTFYTLPEGAKNI